MSAKDHILFSWKKQGVTALNSFHCNLFSIPLSARCFQYPSLLLHVPRISLSEAAPVSLSVIRDPSIPLSDRCSQGPSLLPHVPRIPLSNDVFPESLRWVLLAPFL